MSNLCNHFFGVKSKNTHPVGTLRAALKTTSLACILATTALTACNNEESFNMPDAGKLSINVAVNHPTSRSLITAATLPDGDEGAIGVMLTDGDGTLTDYDAYTNVKFTGATASGSQKWTGATDVLLTENPGTLYAYYPWKDGTNLSAIAIETASQTDYLYATPVTGICETKANAQVAMNHVLTNINLSFADGTYAGVGNITSVSVSGDGIATGGTFNAAQETPAFVADSYSGVGDAITNTTATTLGGNAIDIMVVSNDANKPITITATIDDVEYTATTSAVELAKGNSYQYTLTLNSTFMSVSNVTVTLWNTVNKGELTMEKLSPWKIIANGVYAVSADGKPVEVASADASCIGVAFVTDNQRIMIPKEDAVGFLYWGKNLYEKDITTLTNFGLNDFSGAMNDFNGKNNTEAIIAGYTEHNVNMNTYDMCKVLETYNEGGFKDWYVPSFGQLWEMMKKKEDINTALLAISGHSFSEVRFYWSSTEYSSLVGRGVDFLNNTYDSDSKKKDFCVRFVRNLDFDSMPFHPTINSSEKENGIYIITATGELVDKSIVDPTAIGVALIVNDAPTPQRIMIAKTDAKNETNNTFYWGKSLKGEDVGGINNISSGNGYIGEGKDYGIDYTTWKTGPVKYFNGKANTKALIGNYVSGKKVMDSQDMYYVLNYYNAGIDVITYGDNQHFNDWYIPDCGQLALIYLNKTEIDEALANIGGTALAAESYWSSSEYSLSVAWYISFSAGYISDAYKDGSRRVRFVRDI